MLEFSAAEALIVSIKEREWFAMPLRGHKKRGSMRNLRLIGAEEDEEGMQAQISATRAKARLR